MRRLYEVCMSCALVGVLVLVWWGGSGCGPSAGQGAHKSTAEATPKTIRQYIAETLPPLNGVLGWESVGMEPRRMDDGWVIVVNGKVSEAYDMEGLVVSLGREEGRPAAIVWEVEYPHKAAATNLQTVTDYIGHVLPLVTRGYDNPNEKEKEFAKYLATVSMEPRNVEDGWKIAVTGDIGNWLFFGLLYAGLLSHSDKPPADFVWELENWNKRPPSWLTE